MVRKEETDPTPETIPPLSRKQLKYGVQLQATLTASIYKLEGIDRMKGRNSMESAGALIDQKIKELGDWRGKTLATVRTIIHAADPGIVEEVKWRGTPVFSHGGIICTGETYKNAVKLTFAKGASLPDPSGLFNSSLDGNVRRAIDIHEDDKIDAAALKALIRAAVALNLEKTKTKPGRPTAKRAD
jgi:hypothetical protein